MGTFLKKKKRELTFILAAGLLLFAVLGAVGEGIGFLVRGLNNVFGSGAAVAVPTVRFDIEGAKKLEL
ncbi:MAG: hypothetical protein Q8Q41_01245 [bacterium]|nr:hypothetical protein [bacterium]